MLGNTRPFRLAKTSTAKGKTAPSKPIEQRLGAGLIPPSLKRTPIDSPESWIGIRGHANYQKLLLDCQVHAILTILGAYVSGCFRSASGRMPNAAEVAEFNTLIAAFPPSIQAQLQEQFFADFSRPQVLPPNDPTPAEQEATEFIRHLIDYRIGRNFREDADDVGRNFATIIRQTLKGGFVDGFAVEEVDWLAETAGQWTGKYTVNDVLHWHPSYFKYDATGALTMKATKTFPGGVVPAKKFLTWAHDPMYEDPTGTPLIQKFAYPVFYKWNDLFMGHLSLERFGAPTVTGQVNLDHVPEGFTPETYLAYWNESVLPNVHNGGSMAFSKEDQVVILESARRSGYTDFEAAVVLQDRQMSKAGLGSALALEEGSTGSLALASATAAPALRAIVNQYVQAMNELFSRKLIAWSVFFNYPADVRPPTLNMTLPLQLQPGQTLSATMTAATVTQPGVTA